MPDLLLSLPVSSMGAQLAPSINLSWFQVVVGSTVNAWAIADKAAVIAQYAADANFGGWEILDAGDTMRRVYYRSDLGNFLSVKSYGAVGDGVTDDTTAINAAFAALRASRSTAVDSNGLVSGLSFEPGTYLITGTINATGISAFNCTINGNGAVLQGKCNGLPVLDMLGSRFITLKNLTVYGDTTARPTFGIVTGRIANGASVGEMTFDDVNISGYFSVANFYNLAGETCQYRHCRWYNNDNTAGSVVCLLDAMNDQNITSAFITETIATGTAQSFNEQLFIGCDFRKAVGGKCVKIIGNTSRTHFLNCYAVSVNDAVFFVYKATQVKMLHIDCHCETTGSTLNLLFDTTAASGNVIVNGLTVRDDNSFASTAIIDVTGNTRQLVIDAADIDLGDPVNSIPIFGSTWGGISGILVVGRITWRSAKTLNLGNCQFNGEFVTRNAPTVTHTLGAYKMSQRPSAASDRANMHKGEVRAVGTAAGTAPNDYAEIFGSDTAGTVGRTLDE